VHEPTATAREALRFSALLRQLEETPLDDKYDYVETINKLLEMGDITGATIAAQGNGLNKEQRKRLTIGVELASKPRLLIFLDDEGTNQLLVGCQGYKHRESSTFSREPARLVCPRNPPKKSCPTQLKRKYFPPSLSPHPPLHPFGLPCPPPTNHAHKPYHCPSLLLIDQNESAGYTLWYLPLPPHLQRYSS